MAMILRKNFTANVVESVVEKLDHGMRHCVDRLRANRPVLVMHWVEEPGGRVTYHWDIAMPQADAPSH